MSHAKGHDNGPLHGRAATAGANHSHGEGYHGSDGHHDDGLHAHGDTHGHGSMRSYVLGFVLSAILTIIPFWLVMGDVLQNAQATALIIIVFAVVQILVHTVCFLHVNTQAEGGWTLMAYAFTAVLVLITIGGSLWIMFHLDTNMMPGMPTGTAALTTP